MAEKGLYYISSRVYKIGVGWSEWSRTPYNGEFYADYLEAKQAIEEIGDLERTDLKVCHVGSYPFVNFK